MFLLLKGWPIYCLLSLPLVQDQQRCEHKQGNLLPKSRSPWFHFFIILFLVSLEHFGYEWFETGGLLGRRYITLVCWATFYVEYQQAEIDFSFLDTSL